MSRIDEAITSYPRKLGTAVTYYKYKTWCRLCSYVVKDDDTSYLRTDHDVMIRALDLHDGVSDQWFL